MTAAIETRDLRYRYPDGTEALRGITLRIATGERVGLIGPNGAGKSTLLQHLNGLLPERPVSPSPVRIHGMPVEAARLGEVRRAVGMVFQDPDDQIFCPTVYEDVAFGPGQLGLDVPTTVAGALARVGLSGFEDRPPHHLSRGEKRRVCLAGVLACAPTILVLDEPTGDLDPRGRRELREILRGIAATTIIATHDLELVVDLCPRAILLDGGAIVADAPAVALLNDEPLMLAHGLERPHVLRHAHPH